MAVPVTVQGRVARGHRVASGEAPDSIYPAGTIRLQLPFFLERGIDLRGYHPATINLDIAPLRFRLLRADMRVEQLAWTDRVPPESFSFCRCGIGHARGEVQGLIYYPHPETKVVHFQSPSIIELLAPYMAGLTYGACLTLRVPAGRIAVYAEA